MVQLKVYDGTDQYFLDLLPTEPIKLTLSIEDITNADARSVFSRTFRVPSTKNNNRFFKNAFLVDGIDFDVTVKKSAEIIYNGAEFKIGHIRMQRIYHNKMDGNVEYEVVFLGETRDFASALGEKTIADLDLTMYDHQQTYDNIVLSWQAYPEGAATDGLFNGDILYPLVNFGETDETEVRIAYGTGQTYFNHPGPGIGVNRFKPMIRAKALWDRIFAEAGFTYSSAIADSDLFRPLYISAFGNQANTVEPTGSANRLNVQLVQPYFLNSWGTPLQFEIIPWTNEILDPNNNYSITTYKYTVPTSVSGTDNNGPYVFNTIVNGAACIFNGSSNSAQVTSRLRWYDQSAGTTTTINTITSTLSSVPGLSGECTPRPYNHLHNFTYTLNEGDQVWVEIAASGDIDAGVDVDNNTSQFAIIDAPGNISISTQLDDNYKQIDFIKDMLTKFRLVMAPDRIDARKFIVEPWVDYIATGDLHDWSSILDESKDITLEPLFFTQSARIEFSDKEDADFLNNINLKKFKETFGTLKIDSDNELLKGKREVKTNFAPTPMTQIEGASVSNFLIPNIYARDTKEDLTQQGPETVMQHIPIKPVTRILFYNGLFQQEGLYDQNGNPFGPTETDKGEWYILDENGVSQAQYSFPKISYWQNFDPVTGPNGQTININWQIERGYANDYAQFDWTAGISMYTRFWKDYIESLYSKYARRFTGYFILSAEDLFNFSFDDVVFVNGSYYRPEVVTDVIVGERSAVKVQLIKLLNYGVPNPFARGAAAALDTENEEAPTPDPPQSSECNMTISRSVTPISNCDANDGWITWTWANGTADYTVVITENGGWYANFTNPYPGITIGPVGPATYAITVTDSNGCEVTDSYIMLNPSCDDPGPSGPSNP